MVLCVLVAVAGSGQFPGCVLAARFSAVRVRKRHILAGSLAGEYEWLMMLCG